MLGYLCVCLLSCMLALNLLEFFFSLPFVNPYHAFQLNNSAPLCSKAPIASLCSSSTFLFVHTVAHTYDRDESSAW